MRNSLLGLNGAPEKAPEDFMAKRHDACCTLPSDKRRVHNLILAESSRRSRHRKGICAEAEYTKTIKSQLAEPSYVAYDDAANHRANELKS